MKIACSDIHQATLVTENPSEQNIQAIIQDQSSALKSGLIKFLEVGYQLCGGGGGSLISESPDSTEACEVHTTTAHSHFELVRMVFC